MPRHNRNYAEKVVGVASYENYFNAGILVMNLKENNSNAGGCGKYLGLSKMKFKHDNKCKTFYI